MIARATILLPFELFIREGDDLQVLTWAAHGYEIRFYTPFEFIDRPKVTDSALAPVVSLKHAQPAQFSDNAILDGRRVAQVNVLRLDFIKPEFDRSRSNTSSDPSAEVIFESANAVLAKIRVYSRAFQINPLVPARDPWQITYLTDDGREVENEEGKKRIHVQLGVGLSFPPLTPEVLSLVAGPQTGEPYLWDQLLLDANVLLPNVGAAIVMASAALESFIAWALDILHQERELPAGLWTWIRNRDHFTKEPSVSEKFDILLRAFTGHSLKDQPVLWQAFRELRSARNTLVHEGAAVIGTTIVDATKTRQLIIGAENIIKWVEQLLPESRRRARTEAIGPFGRRLASEAESCDLSVSKINLWANDQNRGPIRVVRCGEESER